MTGRYGPPTNQALFQRAKKIAEGKEIVNPSMPEWFRSQGYTTVSVGKVSHHPGGRGGKDWNDSTLIEIPNAWDKHLMPVGDWQHPRGAMHGLAHGEIREKPSDMDVFQAMEGNDDIYPDGAITEEALKQLNLLASDTEKPFLLAVGFIRPHLPFGAPMSYYEKYEGVSFPKIKHPSKPKGKTTWHSSGEFKQYNRWEKDINQDTLFANEIRRHYAACVSFADAQVGKVLTALQRTGAAQNTIVVLWGDHGWHLGEHAIWGKHSLFEESLHAPLIVHYPSMKNKGGNSAAIVETLDLFPTLCELTEIEIPKFIQGKSLTPILENLHSKGTSALAYRGNATTLRTEKYRFILHEDNQVELYDHTSPEKEINNIAKDHPTIVAEMKQVIHTKYTIN